MQAAIDAQSPMALSHGMTACGQQSSIGSDADISIMSWGCDLNAAAPAIGSNATDSAITKANMVRAMAMLKCQDYPAAAGGGQVTTSRAARKASIESLWCSS